MPNSRAEKEPSRDKPGNTIIPETAGEQEQGDPATNRKKTFRQHAEDATDKHDLLGRLLAQ